MLKRKLFIGICFFALIVPLMNISPAAAQTDTSLQDIIDAGEIHVALEAGYPPFE